MGEIIFFNITWNVGLLLSITSVNGKISIKKNVTVQLFPNCDFQNSLKNYPSEKK